MGTMHSAAGRALSGSGLAVWMLAACIAAGEAPEQVGRREDGSSLTPVDQIITPVGMQVELPGLRPQALAISPDGRLLVTAGKTHEVVVIDPQSGVILDRVQPPAEDQAGPPPAAISARNQKPDPQAIESFTGLQFSPDGSRLAMSNVHGSVKIFAVGEGKLIPSHTLPLPPANAPQRAAEIPAGIAWNPEGTRLYVCGNLSNRLLEIDASAGNLLRTFDVGVAPYDVVLVGGRAFVSNWGGRRPGPEDLTGPAGKGTRVRVDQVRHIASEGSVSTIDLTTGNVSEVLAGLHASALAVSPDGEFVVCANAAADTLSILAAATGRVIETVWTKRAPFDLFGAIPNALAFAPDGRRLYVCNAGQNAVAVMQWEPEERGETRLVGSLPVGWYPGAVCFDPQRGQLAVASLKGLPSQPRPRGDTEGFNSHQHQGGISLVPLPDDESLAILSARVDRNMRSGRIASAFLPARLPDAEGKGGVARRAIPERIGEPSLIEHVVYIIKENRTYDQVLGDLPQGRGRKELCIFGEEYTPNQHAVARQFVLLDNTSCCGILSADGHNWSTSATTTDYLEKSFAGFPRSYPDGMEKADIDALAYSPAGFLWDSAILHGKTLRNYGEFMMPLVSWAEPTRPGKPSFADCFASWKAGPGKGQVVFGCEPAIESLRPHSAADTIGYDMRVPDQFRADRVLDELAAYETRGEFPNLVIICLPNDHTSGTAVGAPTPAAYIADNDLAFGRIVEGLSHSRFWPRMAIFSIEDDPQAGWDHVSGFRTTAYIASPFCRRGTVVSTPYNTTSILRTIEQILGIPPLNQFDAAAVPMADCFTDTPDLTPFTALPVAVPLDQMNPDPKAINDPLLKADALASAAMNFTEIDKAPEDALNRILWHAMKGPRAPYPEWAVRHEQEEDDE